MRLIIALIAAIFCSRLVAVAQPGEFEGIIKYKHLYAFDSSAKDSSGMVDAFGTSSAFYYKKGNYKWIYRSEKNTVIEYFDAKTQTVYLQYQFSDTLYRASVKGLDDSLQSFEVYNTIVDTICGLACKKAATLTFLKSNPDYETQRIIYFSADIFIPPNRFSRYRTYGTNKVIKQTKSWPLRIQLKSKGMPVSQTFEAIAIIPQQLPDSEVYLPVNKPIKPLTLF